MPEEFLRLLLGGVGWGLGTLFAGQGDISLGFKGQSRTVFTKYKSQVRSTFLFVSFSNEVVGSLWTASIAVSRSLLRGTSHGGEGSLYVWTVF